MKRDLELIRAILLRVEETPVGQSLSSPLTVDGYGNDVIAEHVRLLWEAGYIEAQVFLSPNQFGITQVEYYDITRLLNDGHEFVANAKNPAIWKKTVNLLSDKGGDVGLTVVKGIAMRMAFEHFGLV
ncbi:MAG: DUF2513 domain-containing protein [Nodosilinea sp. WJT8-NPBG4]|jgi:hypothetical protein|nr:DUF2513 domain-containing protein [Nodosilinea sp. WJT8-NPBG4]